MKRKLSLRLIIIAATAAGALQQQQQARAATESVDLIQNRLIKIYRSKSARAVKTAHDSLSARKYAAALTQAAPILKDPAYADYGLWISAAALRGQANEAIARKSYAAALGLAQRSVESILKIEQAYPYSPFAKTTERDLALSEIASGDASWGQKRFSSAIAAYEKAFLRLAAHDSINRARPENLAHYAEACSKLGTSKAGLCANWLGRFSEIYPRNSEELKSMAKFAPAMLDRAHSPMAVSKLTQAYKAPDLDQVAFDDAMGMYLKEKYKDSIEAFQKFLDEFPRSGHRYRARYWLAQALTQQQKHEEAQKVYTEILQEAPLSYYGILASMATGKNIEDYIDGTMPQAEELDPMLQPMEAMRFKRAQAFAAEKAFELVSFELKDFHWRNNSSSEFLMYLAALNYESKNYPSAFVVLTDLIQRGYRGVYSSYGLRMIFPTPHIESVQKFAAESQLDPVLVLSLIKQESAFDAGAISSAGAMGLMQLMPATATEVLPGIARSDLGEPEANIRVGSRYLKKLLNRFNGNIVLALAGYNAGPNAAERWFKDTGEKRGMLEFIETIPYRETREYVSTIIRNYFWYSKKLNGEAPKSLNYFWNMYGPPQIQPEPTPSATPVEATAKAQ